MYNKAKKWFAVITKNFLFKIDHLRKLSRYGKYFICAFLTELLCKVCHVKAELALKEEVRADVCVIFSEFYGVSSYYFYPESTLQTYEIHKSCWNFAKLQKYETANQFHL